ncbi:hypothetical protein NQ317_005733 [Molorchus minor]|uniref:Uncharacterized protein n=1 Tax=Molorchus minor TaxID=1323400 RepID=A0ABQ9JIK3_9CUCU|nr:hypothetical protein NQ317_005733 [Molorchus minor]
MCVPEIYFALAVRNNSICNTKIRNITYKNGIHRYPVSQEISRYTAYQLLHFFHRNGDDFEDLNVTYLTFEIRTYNTSHCT